MLIYTLLLVNIILPSNYASKRETFNFSDKISIDENYVHDEDRTTFLHNIEKKDIDSSDVGNGNILQRHVIIDESKKELGLIQRKKRQWGAIMAGVSAGVTLTGLGLTLAQTLTEGCFYYPSICRNKRRMEDLERRLIPMRAEYDKLYLHNKKEFLNIMTTNSNNAYVSYYINDTIQNIHTLQELESILSAKLELKFPKIYAKYTDAQHLTSKEYLDNAVGRLEYRISDIRKMLKDQKKAILKMVLIQYLVGAAINTITIGATKVYQRVSLNTKLFNIVKFHGVPLPTSRFSKLRMNNLKMSETQVNSIMKEMAVRRKSEKEAGIGRQSKRPSKMQIAMGVIGFVMEVVAQVLSALQWKKTANKIEKARIDYEKHYAKFLKELNNVRKEKVVLANRWSDIITSFNRTTKVFQTLMDGAGKYTQFNAKVGAPQLPMNTSNPIFDINFQTLNRNNIQSAQERVLRFLRDIDNDVMRLVDKMYARNLLYEKVLVMTDSNTTIDKIFESITGVLKFSQSKTIKEFGTSLTKKDLACAISLLRRDLDEYDFFSLTILRPKCNLTMVEYKKNEQSANTRRNANLLGDYVSKTMNSKKSHPGLADLTESIRNAYFAVDNTEIARYGSKITEKDVLCSIATQFPSKQEYDFISLIPFRSNCETVDKKTFLKMKAKAATVKGISLQINSLLNTCKSFKFCPCPSMIAKMFGISIENVINLIRLKAGPTMEKYCGTTGCICVDLK